MYVLLVYEQKEKKVYLGSITNFVMFSLLPCRSAPKMLICVIRDEHWCQDGIGRIEKWEDGKREDPRQPKAKTLNKAFTILFIKISYLYMKGLDKAPLINNVGLT